MAIIGLLTNFVFKLIEARKEAEKIKRIFSDYRNELDKVGGGQEAVLLQNSLDILRDKKSTQEEIKNAQSAINGILGTEITLQDELLKKGDQRIKQLVAMARANFQANKIVETEEEIKGLYSKHGGEEAMNKKYNVASTFKTKGVWGDILGESSPVYTDMSRIKELEKVLSDANADVKESN